MESRNNGHEAVGLSLYISYLVKICFGALNMKLCLYISPLKEPNRASRSLPLELSAEEKARDYINALDITDKEHIKENYLSNSETEVNDFQDMRIYPGWPPFLPFEFPRLFPGFTKKFCDFFRR
ncbi:hypothetical protein AVEN_260136-1 [Araneus ventricosus]|uniref:Uncharacterized protein n=1 Tax=Araneus ventricosus TaxID=182803 RepID=A0A4Y2DGD7_ARAVE|nr:hypothetical protein AVEN_260136-1 [Araneus ventricosus]